MPRWYQQGKLCVCVCVCVYVVASDKEMLDIGDNSTDSKFFFCC